MDNIKDDNYYVRQMSNDIRFIIEHMKGINYKDFSVDYLLQDSMMFRMIQISENANKLTEEYKSKREDIPWTSIYGLRNRIVHDYGNTDLRIVYETLTEDIPELLKNIGEDNE